ncbi:MAG: metallophosphoesterase [Gammaproteobacteria bacterium]
MQGRSVSPKALDGSAVVEIASATVENKLLDIDTIFKPHNYKLIDTRETKSTAEQKSSEVCFYVEGCGGDGLAAQKKVAELMDEVARGTRKKPKFIILLGDNFYDNGVDSAKNKEAFEKHFYGVFQDHKLTEIAGIPCFIIPGNHDHNLHYWGKTAGDIDFNKIAAQIGHSYLENYSESDKKNKLYAGEEPLDLGKLPPYNMPSRFYSCNLAGNVEKGEHNLEMFFVDSSTYVRDYLNSLSEKIRNPDNQANKLADSAKNKNSMKLLFMHHPLFSVDKRALHSDAKYYLTKLEMDKLAELGFKGNYNEMLDQIMRAQELNFDAVFSAHTHSMLYHLNQSKEKKLCQVVAGGGGGKLEDRRVFTNPQLVPAYMKNHGFVSVTTDLHDPEKKLEFDFYSVEKTHLKFMSTSPTPVRSSLAEVDSVIAIRKAILESCHKYLDFYSKPPPRLSTAWVEWKLFHGSAGAQRADDLINFFNRYEPIGEEEAKKYILDKMYRWAPLCENSLECYLSKSMEKFCKLTYVEFSQGKKPGEQQASLATQELAVIPVSAAGASVVINISPSDSAPILLTQTTDTNSPRMNLSV